LTEFTSGDTGQIVIRSAGALGRLDLAQSASGRDPLVLAMSSFLTF
jgi:hypothetical protein